MNESEKKLLDNVKEVTVAAAKEILQEIVIPIQQATRLFDKLSDRVKDLEGRADGVYGKILASETAMTDVRARLERLEKDNELLREQVRELRREK
jgi:hypothetical protein